MRGLPDGFGQRAYHTMGIIKARAHEVVRVYCFLLFSTLFAIPRENSLGPKNKPLPSVVKLLHKSSLPIPVRIDLGIQLVHEGRLLARARAHARARRTSVAGDTDVLAVEATGLAVARGPVVPARRAVLRGRRAHTLTKTRGACACAGALTTTESISVSFLAGLDHVPVVGEGFVAGQVGAAGVVRVGPVDALVRRVHVSVRLFRLHGLVVPPGRAGVFLVATARGGAGPEGAAGAAELAQGLHGHDGGAVVLAVGVMDLVNWLGGVDDFWLDGFLVDYWLNAVLLLDDL